MSIKFNKSLNKYFALIIFLLILLLISFFNLQFFDKKKKHFLHRIYFNGINNYLHIGEIFFKGLRSSIESFETINIYIDYKDYNQIEKNRLKIIEAINLKKFDDVKFKKVRANITYNKKNYLVNLKLKGQRKSHYIDQNKTSLRIELLNSNIDGIESFSLIKPRIRNYIHEWFFHELSLEGDIPTISYIFLKLKINNQNRGLYVLEESMRKNIFNRHSKKISPIFTINFDQKESRFFKSTVKVYEQEFWTNNKKRKSLYDRSLRNFKFFINEKKEFNKIFNLKKLSWFFAVADLTQTYHGLDPKQLKFYNNPNNNLLEIIPYDGHRFTKNFSKHIKSSSYNLTVFDRANLCRKNFKNCKNNSDSRDYFLYKFFYNSDNILNTDFYLMYISALNKIANKNYIESFLKKRKKEIDKINDAIYKDISFIDNPTYAKYGPGLYYFDSKDLLNRSIFLQNKIKDYKRVYKNIN